MGLTAVQDIGDPRIAVDDTGSTTGNVQIFKLGIGGVGSLSGVLTPDATYGLPVDVMRIQGPYTSGAPIDFLTTKPVLLGGRASNNPPAPTDVDNDAVIQWMTPWGDLNATIHVDAGVIEATSVQPNAAAGYVSGDVIGNVWQFSGAALAAGRGLTVAGARLIDKTGTTKQDIYLEIYDASPASPPADSAGITGLTAANEIAAHPLAATIEFRAANYVRNKCYGTVLGGPFPPLDAHPAGTVLYGIAYFPGTPKALTDGSLWIGLDVQFN